MGLAEFIAANKQRLIDRWKRQVVERLEIALEHTQLVDELPPFLDELIAAVRNPDTYWPDLECARSHGRHRKRWGVDIGNLTLELALIGETIVQLMHEDGHALEHPEVKVLTRVIGQATAASVTAYAAMRDKQLTEQAAQHFSFVAHEIRNPLHTAKLAADLTSMGPPELRERSLARLQRALAQLSELIDNSLLQARLLGAPSLHVEKLDVAGLLAAVHEHVSVQAQARGQTLVSEAQPFELEGDRKLLSSALTNLAQNAVKFTHDGGTITMRASEAGDRALFEIADECGGMPEHLAERLFEPFVQGSADKSGFGLGLAIVKQVIDAHQGMVRVENRPGSGCTFVLDLPLRQAPH